MHSHPYLIELPKTSSKGGQLSVLEESDSLPIEIKRVYWIYGIEKTTERGSLVHLNSDRVMVCLRGTAHITIENIQGEIFSFDLQEPCQALYYPRNHWIKITVASDSVMLVMASCVYNDDQVETDYNKFRQLILS